MAFFGLKLQKIDFCAKIALFQGKKYITLYKYLYFRHFLLCMELCTSFQI